MPAACSNTAAAKLCYQYIAGKPTEPPNPDRLDADAWQRFKETAGMMAEMPGLADKPDPVVPLSLVRKVRPDVTRNSGRMRAVLDNPDAFHAAEEKAREAHFRQLERDSLRAAAKYDGFVPDETGLPPEEPAAAFAERAALPPLAFSYLVPRTTGPNSRLAPWHSSDPGRAASGGGERDIALRNRG